MPRPSPANRRAFVRRTTRLQPVPDLPGVRLHLADDVAVASRLAGAELGQSDPGIPFWAFAWTGGLGIARYLAEHPDEVAGRRVVDVGSGSGLCAIVAAQAGASSVRAFDIDPTLRGRRRAQRPDQPGPRRVHAHRPAQRATAGMRRDPGGRCLLRADDGHPDDRMAPGRGVAWHARADRRPGTEIPASRAPASGELSGANDPRARERGGEGDVRVRDPRGACRATPAREEPR